jgi:hypothetical protein
VRLGDRARADQQGQAELAERLDSIEAAATEPEAKPKTGKQS